MDSVYIFGNMAWNAGLLAVTGYFVKQWMGKMDKRADVNAENIAKQADITRQELAQFTATTTAELKESIGENRIEYNRRADSIIQSIDKLSDHMATANGRTAKLEGKLDTQLKLCDERRRLGEVHFMGEDRRIRNSE